MKEKIKEIFQNILNNTIYDIVKYVLVFTISSGVSFLGAFNFFNYLKLPLWEIIICGIIIASSVSLTSILLVHKYSCNYVHPQKIDCNYIITDKSVSFEYKGIKCEYRSSITMRFKKDTNVYYGKYYWSGSGSGNIRVTNQGFTLTETKRRTRYIEYIVYFDRLYKAGKKLKLNLVGTMNDPNGNFSPYFSTSVMYPTKKLTIDLKINPDKYPIKNLEKEIVPVIPNYHENCEQVYLDENGEYKWEIKNPPLSNQYSLNWIFIKKK